MGKSGWIFILGVAVAIMGSFDLVHIYRRALLAVHEFRFSTKNSYLEIAKTFNPKDLKVDVTGRVFLITGANSGIGKSTALAVAERGGIVHMVCRNKERAKVAKDEIVEKTGNGNIYIHIVDLSDLAATHEFVRNFIKRYNELDVLVNNAGVMNHERTLTPEGLETSFATNTMPYYIMTKELLPVLKQSSRPRVVIVSSAGLLEEKLDVDDLQFLNKPFNGERAYVHNKRQQVIIAEELASLHPDVHFSSMHPGWVDTPALQTSLPEFRSEMKDKLRSPEQGADTVVWLAISEAALSFKSGLFFLDRRPISTHNPFAMTEETNYDRKRLMKELEKISQEMKPSDVPEEINEEE